MDEKSTRGRKTDTIDKTLTISRKGPFGTNTEVTRWFNNNKLTAYVRKQRKEFYFFDPNYNVTVKIEDTDDGCKDT